MEKLTVEAVRDMLGGALYSGLREGTFSSVAIDSRAVKSGALFFALAGKRKDGHDFAASAVRKGAAGVVVSRDVKLPKKVPCFKVRDVLRSMGKMARQHLKTTGAKVIAVTGSNGKTTTKEMIYHVIREKTSCTRSERSYNTEIGVPLAVFNVKKGQEYCILEMGTNAPGEIRYLARIAHPSIGVVTNISRTHLEGLRDIHGVARAKGELVEALKPGEVAVLNHDDEWVQRLVRHTRGEVVWFGLEPTCTAFADNISFGAASDSFDLNGKFPVKLNAPGGFNVGNALAAAAVAIQLGLKDKYIAQRLTPFKLPDMRMQRIRAGGVALINEAYNANEASVTAAAHYLHWMKTKGERYFVLGDMRELGAETGRAHRNVGKLLGLTSIEHIVTVGRDAGEAAHEARRCPHRRSESVSNYTTLSGAARFLAADLKRGDVVLFKGSRGMQLEKLVKEVQEELKARKGGRRA